MTGRLRLFSPLDAIVIVLCFTAAVLAIPFLRSGAADEVVVYRDNAVIAVYPLSEDRMVAVEGRNGPVTIAISGKSVRVVQVNCPRHLCERATPISNPGGQIVCVPNHLLLQVRSSRASRALPDAVAQ